MKLIFSIKLLLRSCLFSKTNDAEIFMILFLVDSFETFSRFDLLLKDVEPT